MTSPARTATLPRNDSPAHSHMAPLPQPPPQSAISDLPKGNSEKMLPENRTPQTPTLSSSAPIPTPLNPNILQEPYPSGFQMPQLETYDGTKNPDDHLHAFCSIMQAQNASDALMCKIFPSTLRGNARTWYYSLQPSSVSSYAELAAFFATKFSSRRLIKKTTFELMRVAQREGESLKNYMNRFNNVVLEISSFNHGVGLAALIAGLKRDRFRDSLIKHAPTTFDEANERSWKFIQAEEYALSGKATPSKESPPATRDHSKYCDFHQDHGHTTEECQSLKSELEGLARKGMLNEYVSKGDQPKFVREQGRPGAPREASNRVGVGYQQAPPPLPPPSRIIHMITGGLEAGIMSSKQQKLYVREVKHQNRVQKRKFDETDWRNQPITFRAVDFDGVITPHNDPLVTSIIVNSCEVHRVLVDTGSASNIMYYHCFESLGLDPALLQKYDGPIYGFNNQPILVEGVLTLKVAFGSGRTYVTPSVRFLVVKMASSFNIVIGRLTLTEIRAVVSQSHLCMKFPTLMGVATLRGNQEIARHYYMTSVTLPRRDKLVTPAPIQAEIPSAQQVMGIELPDYRLDDDARATPVEETSADMPGIPASVAVHKLGTNPLKKPVTQKRRLFEGERLQAIKEEVQKLLQAGFIRRVDYCEWVANPVLVKKSNGKWHMCIDYTNLNDACPKDYHPLPNIDKLVEAASRNERLSLLDAYSRYHQVHMASEDEVKTSFYAGDEIYCYVMMPFGLKNAGATYQKMVTIVFRAQIGRNLEVYVDDIVVKSRRAEDHLTDLGETFNNLKRHSMKLNPAKCVFGVESEKFLGFLVSRRGIEVNPEKIKAIEEMKPPKSIKDVQRLTGRVAALHRFISKSTDRCFLFFKILRSTTQKGETEKPRKFEWTPECQTSFEELKAYLSSPPLLTKAEEGDTLYLYLGISDTALSSVLIRETAQLQRPVYYTSKVLQGVELRYSTAEKATLAVVATARKLRPYFQAHPIVVLIDLPLRQILQKPECSGRLIKWVVELGEFQITFQQRSSVRGQALADFVVECTFDQKNVDTEVEQWTLYVDGASNSKGAGARAVLIGPEHFRSEHALKFNFEATNNMAEYEALLLELRLAVELKVTSLQVYSDSQLVVNQVNSLCEVADPVVAKYLALVSKLKCQFEQFRLTKVPRSENEHADSLSQLASDTSRGGRSIYVEVLNAPSFQKIEVLEVSTDPETASWTDPIKAYLQDGTVPTDKQEELKQEELKQEELKLRRKASRYTLLDGILYKRSYSLPLLYCLTSYEAEYALHEVHEGVCGSHVGARTLAHKPAEELRNLVAPWPFAQWGLDLLGPFVKGVGGVTHLVMVVDYFTKWVEARPLSGLTSRRIEDFVFSAIICRYGIPNQIVTDNGPQFNCTSFRDFCSSYGIKLLFTSVYHPETNGMVESVNKAILEGIKPRTATGETPYHLAFGTEAIIPVELGVPSLRVSHFDSTRNDLLLREDLDLLDEVREHARLWTIAYKQKIANFYNKRVQPRSFKIGDLVLRKAGLTGFETRFGKLAPNWEGPYVVAEVPHPRRLCTSRRRG
ncbi:hypothetical protein SLEP1_g24299 [Rubroshorea leprosula]|uniref:Uncharacterized protein n=1 Tax=Rubroshorea leprosula TaxID=152421 RepID=A0AAV5JPF0_9ROSI|nr:hypothetical protein SLEP1_g24299 [Rubroshorea leprosula]